MKTTIIVTITLVFLLSSITIAAPASIHVFIGDKLSQASETPEQAFTYGFLSHIILDKTINQYSFSLKEPDVPYLTLDLTAALVQVYSAFKAKEDKRLWGMLGSITPDLLVAVEMVVNGDDNWQKGKSVFHKDRLTKTETMILIGLCSIAF